MAKTETCETCRFFKDSNIADVSGPWPGSCRRRAPVANGFPATSKNGWCGEYEEKKVDAALCECGHFLSAHSHCGACIVCGCVRFEVAQ